MSVPASAALRASAALVIPQIFTLVLIFFNRYHRIPTHRGV
jgi:hypothetical protein